MGQVPEEMAQQEMGGMEQEEPMMEQNPNEDRMAQLAQYIQSAQSAEE